MKHWLHRWVEVCRGPVWRHDECRVCGKTRIVRINYGLIGPQFDPPGPPVPRPRNPLTAPPATELPPPGPSNIVVRTPNPLPAPERVEDQ